MNTFESLVARLDAVDASDVNKWEEEYSREAVEFTHDQVKELVHSDRDYAERFVFRFEAGAPGSSLPTMEDAFKRVVSGIEGTPLDAYQLAVRSSPHGDRLTPELQVHVLYNAALCALKEGRTWFSSWLAARAGLAAIALGKPERAWQLLDLFKGIKSNLPQLAKLEAFEPLRQHEVAQSPWIRATIQWLWPGLGVSIISSLSKPRFTFESHSLADTLDELSRVGATKVRDLVGSYLRSAGLEALERYAHEPLVRELERRVLRGCLEAPNIEQLPIWFIDWAKAVVSSKQFHLARLAGLVIHSSRDMSTNESEELAAILILPTARASDLEILAKGLFHTGPSRSTIEEIREAVKSLPLEAADALVAAAMPNTDRHRQAFIVLSQYIDLLDGLGTPGGHVEFIASATRAAFEEQSRDRVAVKSQWERLSADVKRNAAPIDRFGAQIRESEVVEAAEAVIVTELNYALLEVATASSEDLSDIERIVLFLALRHSLNKSRDADLLQVWRPALAQLASTEIARLPKPQLSNLRLRLIDEAIMCAHPAMPLAELYFQRASVKRTVGKVDKPTMDGVLEDCMNAILQSRAEGNMRILALATKAWITTKILGLASDDSNYLHIMKYGESLISFALSFPMPPFEKSALLQARALLLSLKDPQLALPDLEEALSLLEPSDVEWIWIAADLVEILVRANRAEEALQRGEKYLNSSGDAVRGVELGKLHQALGQAFLVSGERDKARFRFTDCLNMVRGNDRMLEATTRLHLAHLELVTGEYSESSEHIKFLKDHRDELPPTLHMDVDLLQAELLRATEPTCKYREALSELLSESLNERIKIGLRLKIARTDLSEGHDVEDLDELVLAAIGNPLDVVHTPILDDLLSQLGDQLDAPTQEKVLNWASQRPPSVRARMQNLAGNKEAARATLNEALGENIDDFERFRCVHQLLTVIDSDSAPNRLELIEMLEQLLERWPETHNVRLDLASLMYRAAEGDLTLVKRSISHAQKALKSSLSAREREIGERLVAVATCKLLQLSLPLSSPSIASLAECLCEETVLEESFISAARMDAAFLLLLVGPLTHPAALDVAARLLAMVGGPPDAEMYSRLSERLRSLQTSKSTRSTNRSMNAIVSDPFDDMPRWITGLVRGQEEDPTPDQIAECSSLLELVVNSRPDVADTLLSKAISVQHELLSRPRQELLEAVYHSVRATGETGEEKWPRVREAIKRTGKKNKHSMLKAILDATTGPIAERLDNSFGIDSVFPAGARDQALALYTEGVSLLEGLQSDPFAPDAIDRITKSREHLSTAVSIAYKKRMPHLFSFLVSQGNAWRSHPRPDLKTALAIYAEAEKHAKDDEQKAQLWKVKADALLNRGEAQDLRDAERLLAKSCRIRRGRFLAETFFSRAQVALVHPDFDAISRERKAAEFVMEAIRSNRDFGDQKAVVGFICHRLHALEQVQSEALTAARWRDELRALLPSRASEIDAFVPPPTEDELRLFIELLRHPAGSAFLEIRMALITDEEISMGPYGQLEQFGPSVKETIARKREHDSLVGRPDRVEQRLRELESVDDDASQPGRLAARLLLLANLARQGRRPAGEVHTAVNEAVEAIGRIDNLLVRSSLLREVAAVLAPYDPIRDSVRDFPRAVELLRECMEFERGEEHALDDTIYYLAHALRYSNVGERHTNLRESRRLFALLLQRTYSSGGPDQIAQCLCNLAEVEMYWGIGSRLGRFRTAEKLLSEAVERAQAPQVKAECTSLLAFSIAMVGSSINGDEGKDHLERAMATFDKVDMAAISYHRREFTVDNRQLCVATLARLTDGPSAEIDSWRKHLEGLQVEGDQYRIAAAKLHLTNAIFSSDTLTDESVSEYFHLLKESAPIKLSEGNPRSHWETAMSLARAYRFVLAHEPDPLSNRFKNACERWLEESRIAAAALGPGKELIETAYSFLALADHESTTERFGERIEKAWEIQRLAAAYLLQDRDSRATEARFAIDTARKLAHRLGEETRSKHPTNGINFLLEGEYAQLVERWIARAQRPAIRPLVARLCRPKGVPTNVWDEWLNGLDSGEQNRFIAALESVREHAPDFLAEEQSNDVTWRWLKQRPGAIAVALVFAEQGTLALVLHTNEEGAQITTVLGLALGSPPYPLEELGRVQSGRVPKADALVTQKKLGDWLRAGVVDPIIEFLGRQPSEVLWNPDPEIRLVSPGVIWREIPVATTTSLVLPDRSAAPSRRPSTLVVLADPGPESHDPRRNLQDLGVRALKSLEAAAGQKGAVRVMGSVGRNFGRPLLGEQTNVCDCPASSGDVLREASNHQIVVVVAHGEANGLGDAALLCLDLAGNIDRLDVSGLAQSPDSFAGATVILLSCESGRMRNSLVDPGGLAGTLLATGAACVVAPMWPVRLDVAEKVGCALLEGLANDEEPWTVLAKVQLRSSGSSPTLGAPPPSSADRQAELEIQRLGFAVWLG